MVIKYDIDRNMDDLKKIEAYIEKHDKWADGLQLIRKELLELDFTEEVKWGMPTYTIDGKNLIGLSGFKNHFGLWFHQGAFLSDPLKLLENAQEGKTRGMRHIKFRNSNEVRIADLKPYLLETIENHKEGKEIKPTKREKNLEMPDLMRISFGDLGLKAFNKISASKQNEYIEYIITAKREATKLSRLEKIKPMILAGSGLNDMYK